MTNKRTLNLEGLNLFCYSSVHQKRSEAEFSCVSMRSDASMNQPIDYKSEDTKTDLRSNISVKDYLIMIQNT